VTLKLDISAGEFFELIRPTVLVLSAVISVWVLASARRYRFPLYVAIAAALGTLFFPLITLPLFLIARFFHRRSGAPYYDRETGETLVPSTPTRRRVTLPLIYAVIVLSMIGFYLYSDHQSVDGHLARAVQSKLLGKRGRAINEYRAALKLDDDPHTRKLLAIELADTGDRTGALFELRTAEQRGEADDLIAFHAANLLDSLNLPNQATLEYQRFLESRACTQPLPDERCAGATLRVQAVRAEGLSR
jgi:hypothetical protein